MPAQRKAGGADAGLRPGDSASTGRPARSSSSTRTAETFDSKNQNDQRHEHMPSHRRPAGRGHPIQPFTKKDVPSIVISRRRPPET